MNHQRFVAYGPLLLLASCSGGGANSQTPFGTVGDGSETTEASASTWDDASPDTGTTGSADGSGGSCQASGTCVPGDACVEPQDCALGHCIDEICCESACDGPCVACSADGLCEATGQEQDPACMNSCADEDNCGGETEWGLSFGGPAEGESYDRIIDVVVDAQGNIYVVGSFEGEIDLGGGALSSAGGSDLFIASFAPNRIHRWSRRYGAAGSDTAHSAALLPSGDIVVGGSVNGSPGFAGAWPDAGLRGFVMTLDAASGTPTASTEIASSSTSRVLDVDVNVSGEIFAVGGFFEDLQTGGVRTSVGDEDVFVVKFDGALGPQWNWTYGELGKDLLRGLTVSPQGSVAVVGYVTNPDVVEGTTPGLNLYVAHLADGPAPTVSWANTYASSVDAKDKAHNVDSLAGGDVVLTGFFGADVNFGSGQLTSAGDSDVFVARLAKDTGAAVWASSFGSSGADVAHAIAVDASDDLIIAGRFNEQLSFGGPPLEVVGGKDAFVAKFQGATGTHVWSHAYGGELEQSLLGVTTDGRNSIYVAGQFTGTIDVFDPPLVAADDVDAFLVKLAP